MCLGNTNLNVRFTNRTVWAYYQPVQFHFTRTGFITADAVRLTAVQMEFIIPDENGGKLPTRFVPVSDPHPVVTLAELTADDVDIANGTATFSISGEVTDAIADNIPNHLADIETIRVLVNDEESVVPTALEAGDDRQARNSKSTVPVQGCRLCLQRALPRRSREGRKAALGRRRPRRRGRPPNRIRLRRVGGSDARYYSLPRQARLVMVLTGENG